eukprot:SAG31_NODE_79_length_27235_cov_6.268868_9_plen_292_part_00
MSILIYQQSSAQYELNLTILNLVCLNLVAAASLAALALSHTASRQPCWAWGALPRRARAYTKFSLCPSTKFITDLCRNTPPKGPAPRSPSTLGGTNKQTNKHTHTPHTARPFRGDTRTPLPRPSQPPRPPHSPRGPTRGAQPAWPALTTSRRSSCATVPAAPSCCSTSSGPKPTCVCAAEATGFNTCPSCRRRSHSACCAVSRRPCSEQYDEATSKATGFDADQMYIREESRLGAVWASTDSDLAYIGARRWISFVPTARIISDTTRATIATAPPTVDGVCGSRACPGLPG